MLAYANPEDRVREKRRWYGIARFHKPSGKTIFECWPRFVDASDEDSAHILVGQFLSLHLKTMGASQWDICRK